MTTKERYAGVLKWFGENMPSPHTELHYTNPYEILVAVILSAQCTDKRINMVTPALFKRFPTPEDMAKSTTDEIFEYIKSVTFPNNKAKSLLGMANKLVDCFGGNVPSSIDDLVTIPGVGRKTANVILAVVYDQPSMAVDTHVFRVSNRIGLTKESPNPLTTEKTLVKNIPEELIPKAHHWLILHGRYVCMARKPNCPECGIRPYCDYYQRTSRGETVILPKLNHASGKKR